MQPVPDRSSAAFPNETAVLQGSHVRLEPLTPSHLDDLALVGLDPDLWRWIPSRVSTLEDLRDYIQLAVRERELGKSVPFAVVELASGRAIGSTRYAAIDTSNRRLEIGWSWIGAPWQATVVNPEMKYLMLRYAFDELGYTRVELKTDALNVRSRAAILKLGATEEGLFRRHMVCEDGRVRDTVYFSIIDTDWPAVKARLIERVHKTGTA
jgi:RimJ/RimL family protein N-acetyltransferase